MRDFWPLLLTVLIQVVIAAGVPAVPGYGLLRWLSFVAADLAVGLGCYFGRRWRLRLKAQLDAIRRVRGG